MKIPEKVFKPNYDYKHGREVISLDDVSYVLVDLIDTVNEIIEYLKEQTNED